ncbi:hypothetical protein [Ruegeria arenilitoris]|uniref:hypothetical protein n=1 Tax=Ruegeria arenilitoris TaxID=1173585 RepID=UPI00147C5C2B|nr:hypothetical protein [Ruegeria arenilitoris]
MRLICFFVLCLVVNSAAAQDALPLPLQTRFGTLEEGIEVGCNRTGDVCLEHATTLLDGKKLWTHSNRVAPEFLRVFQWGEDKDVVLVRNWSGGAHCCTGYVLLSLKADDVTFSDEFGAYGHTPSMFRVSEEGISFRLERDFPATIDHQEVMFDGETTNIRTVYEDDGDAGIAGADIEVSKWLGHRPSEFWEDGAERNRFRQIMPEEALNCLRTSTSLGTEFELKDGYLFASGMWPSQGGSRHGYIAIEVSTGLPFAAQMWGDDVHIFGAQQGTYSGILADWVQQDVTRLRERHQVVFGSRVAELSYTSACS